MSNNLNESPVIRKNEEYIARLEKRANNQKIANQVLWGVSAASLGFAFTNMILAKNKKVIPYKRTTPELFKNFTVAPAGPNGLYFRKTFYLH